MEGFNVHDTGQSNATSTPMQGLKLNLQDLAPAKQPHAMSSTSDKNVSSAPPTPGSKTSLSRRASHVPPSPNTFASSPRPDPLRRASSSASFHRAPASPKLNKKPSRTSLNANPTNDDKPDRRPTPKRSISNLISGLREAQATMTSIPEPTPQTASQIAIDHFTHELATHSQPLTSTTSPSSSTIVILHDACYSHRFSRQKATKSTLAMIVERPERIHASILGAATAYVRLGGHHAGGLRAPRPLSARGREEQLETVPPFRIRRSKRRVEITDSCVTAVHGTAWMGELKGMCGAARERLAAGQKELVRSSGAGDEGRSLHEGDLYLAPESLEAFEGALGGVADAVDEVFTAGRDGTRRAFVAVRPPGHHCSADWPSGFCWVNNVHVGIEYAAQTHGLTHAAIVDFDLHHGDGSQAIAWQRNSANYVKRLNVRNNKAKLGPDIGYYSVHDINSYPCEMGDDEKVQAASLCIENAHNQSIWNVHLQTWKTEDDFWKLYEERYRILLDKARIFLQHYTTKHRLEGKTQPKAAIFISAGFDASEWEGEGMQRHKVNVPTEFYARFTADMVQLAQEADSGCEGRVISVLEGGYSDRALCSGVLSHLSGLSSTIVKPITNGVGSILGLSDRLGSLAINGHMEQTTAYSKTWWSADNLTALENKVNPPPPVQGKKVRAGPQPTYATPTESFAYKVIDPQNFARSISGTMRQGPAPVRPPTPPAPEVDWVVATQELSKLLIPTDRQTKSCTPEELAAPRTKKDRQSAAAALPNVDTAQPRQLRDRRIKGPVYPESTHSDELESLRSVSRSSRRETIAVLPSSDDAGPSQRRPSRRLSTGSTLSVANSELDLDAPPVPSLPATMASDVQGSTRTAAAPSAALQMKKTRVPVQPRKRPDAPVKPPVPANVPAPRPAIVNRSTPTDGQARAVSQSNDLDALTTGMKKITLKVGTKEEHDRKQKERLDAERRARALKGAETRRVNAAAKKAALEKAASPPAAPAKVQVQPVTAESATNVSFSNGPASLYDAPPGQESLPIVSAKVEIGDDNLQGHSTLQATHLNGPVLNVAQQNGIHDASNQADPFVPINGPMNYGPPSTALYQPQVTTPVIVKQEPVDYLARMSQSSPVRPMSRENLPVWSATGPIPFGRPASQGDAQK